MSFKIVVLSLIQSHQNHYEVVLAPVVIPLLAPVAIRTTNRSVVRSPPSTHRNEKCSLLLDDDVNELGKGTLRVVAVRFPGAAADLGEELHHEREPQPHQA